MSLETRIRERLAVLQPQTIALSRWGSRDALNPVPNTVT